MRTSTGTSGCSISSYRRSQRRHALDLRPQRLVQPQGHVGVLGRVLRGALHRHLVEADLLRAFAGHVLVVDGSDAEVAQRRGIHVVPVRDAVPDIGLEHGVVAHAGELDAMVGQHMRVVLEMMPSFGLPGSSRMRLAASRAPLAVELLGRARIVVRQRHIGGHARLDAEGDADDLRVHIIQTGGLGVEREELCVAQLVIQRSRSSQSARVS